MSGTNIAFIDTNILIYWADESAGQKHHIARQLIANPTEQIFLSPQVISEFCNVMVRKVGVPMFTLIPVISMFRTQCRVTVDFNFVHEAAMICTMHSFSIFDAQILEAAVRSGCTKLYSEDMQHGFRYQGVEIINPFLNQ